MHHTPSRSHSSPNFLGIHDQQGSAKDTSVRAWQNHVDETIQDEALVSSPGGSPTPLTAEALDLNHQLQLLQKEQTQKQQSAGRPRAATVPRNPVSQHKSLSQPAGVLTAQRIPTSSSQFSPLAAPHSEQSPSPTVSRPNCDSQGSKAPTTQSTCASSSLRKLRKFEVSTY